MIIVKKFFIVALIAVALAAALPAHAQKLSSDNFIGLWKSDGTMVQNIFFRDGEGQIRLVAWDEQTKLDMKIESLKVDSNTIETIEYFESTKWRTKNVYTLVDENTIRNVISGDGHATVYFKRVDTPQISGDPK